jgi:tetratricopeptide (TPR) repeat protein
MCLLCDTEQEELICSLCMGEKSDDRRFMLLPDTIFGTGPLRQSIQEAVLTPGFDITVQRSGRALEEGLERPISDDDGGALSEYFNRLMRLMGIPVVLDLHGTIPLYEDEIEALDRILDIILNNPSPANKELLLRAGTILWHHAMHLKSQFSSNNGKKAGEVFHLALRLYIEAKSLEPDDLTLRNIAITLHFLEDHRAALEYCEMLSGKEDPQLLLIKGLSLKAEGRSEEALGCMESIMGRNPSPQVLDEVGRLFFSLDRTDKALEAFENALEIDPNSEVALLSKYHFLNHIHEDEEARAYLGKR